MRQNSAMFSVFDKKVLLKFILFRKIRIYINIIYNSYYYANLDLNCTYTALFSFI